jgi:hypothetical protein
VLSAAKSRSEMSDFLVSHHFHEHLFLLLPSSDSLITLGYIAEHSQSATGWLIDNGLMDRLRSFLPAQDAITCDAIWFFGGLATSVSCTDLLPFAQEIAVLGMTSLNYEVACDSFRQLATLSHCDFAFALIVFQAIEFSNFLANLREPMLSQFLYFLTKAFTNRLAKEPLSNTLPDLGEHLLAFLFGCLLLPDDQTLDWTGRAISYTIFQTDTVAYCFSIGMHDRLFEMLQEARPFRVLTSLFQALCTLVASGDAEEVGCLMERGFAAAMETFIAETAHIIPYQIIEALDNVRILARTRANPQWLAIFSEPVVDALYEMAQDEGFGQDAKLFCDVPVTSWVDELVHFVGRLAEE